MLNIFQHLRSLKVNLTDESIIKFEAEEAFISSSYCGRNIRGAHPYYVVDGQDDTAWANDLIDTIQRQYFIFNFLQRKVSIQRYSISTLCNPPLQLYVEGSNDKNSQWTILSHVPTALGEFSTYSFSVQNRNHYQYIRFRQTRSNTSNRFIIHNIELYGTFGSLPTCEVKKPFICYSVFYTFLFGYKQSEI